MKRSDDIMVRFAKLEAAPEEKRLFLRFSPESVLKFQNYGDTAVVWKPIRLMSLVALKSQSAPVLVCVPHAVSHTNRPQDNFRYLLNLLSWLNTVHGSEALLDPSYILAIA